MKILGAALAGTMLALSAASALALPVQWTVPASPLTSSGTIEGTFTYDADTNTYSNLDLRIERDGVTTHFAHVGTSNGYYQAGRLLARSSLALGDVAELHFSPALTNAGGISTLAGVFEGSCADPCTGYLIETPSNPATTITATPPPPPAPIPTMTEWAMILLAALLAGGAALTIQRRRAA